MPHTYTNLWYHMVFGTKNRLPLIEPDWRARLHQYLGGTMRGLGDVARSTALQITFTCSSA